MNSKYPQLFSEIRLWARDHGRSIDEAKQRYVQYTILQAISNSRRLSDILVLKGGNALDFAWLPNRSTRDLDFSIDMTQGSDFDEVTLLSLLTTTLRAVGQVSAISFKVHSVERQPPGEDKIFVTLIAKIGYALEDDPRNRVRIESGGYSTNVVPIEISLNEPICADERYNIDDTHTIRISSLEDIVAEKLRALLQQPIRNRVRRQDLLDIAYTLVAARPLNLEQVAHFLIEKSAVHNVPVSKSAFRDPEIAERAKMGYDELSEFARVRFVQFDDALEGLRQLVNKLQIPD